MSTADSSKNLQQVGQSQMMSLLTTSGTLDLYVLQVGKGVAWVLPKSLALDELTLTPVEIIDQQVEWQGHKLPLVILGTKADMTHALLIEGDQDQLRYAIATTKLPVASKIRISTLKDIESSSSVSNAKMDEFVFQYVKHDEQTWIVPDLEKLEKSFKTN
jgi:hypothetical protein